MTQRGGIIQRTPVGPFNQWNTINDQQEEQIKQWLKSIPQAPDDTRGWSILRDVYNRIVSDDDYRAGLYANYIRGIFSDWGVQAVQDYLHKTQTTQNVATVILYLDDILHSFQLDPYVSNKGRANSEYQMIGQHHHELGMSQQDSEVYLLQALDNYIFGNLASVKQKIDIEIISKNGACDGCKRRIEYFANKLCQRWSAGRPDRLELKISYNYLNDPKALTGPRHGSYYGFKIDRTLGMDVLPHSGHMIYTGFRETVINGDIEMG